MAFSRRPSEGLSADPGRLRQGWGAQLGRQLPAGLSVEANSVDQAFGLFSLGQILWFAAPRTGLFVRLIYL